MNFKDGLVIGIMLGSCITAFAVWLSNNVLDYMKQKFTQEG